MTWFYISVFCVVSGLDMTIVSKIRRNLGTGYKGYNNQSRERVRSVCLEGSDR